ncbi:MAG TPA: zinc ribbon domain-containing protein, partial [Gemmatimonadaceae bacterium]|nr:zinc ribbon domain-containing protein [Gemmatimonadaceae bacterium]
MASPVSPSSTNAAAACASCGKPASGKYCSNCGAPLVGATCGGCGASLTPGARFCHRCGTPANAQTGGPKGGDQRNFSAALPWGLAAIALVALVALLAGQHFGRSPDNASAAPHADAAAPFAGATGNGQAPDISNLSPAEAAVRLYNRVMGAHERGRADSVQIFAPMAITAY